MYQDNRTVLHVPENHNYLCVFCDNDVASKVYPGATLYLVGLIDHLGGRLGGLLRKAWA